MKSLSRFASLCLLLPILGLAAEPAPKFDPKGIINDSNGFLKEREPEMTAEEYALYEKVGTMLQAQPEFALKLLEAMVNEKEPPSPAFEFILGNAYYAAGQTEKAEASYRSALKRYPTFLRGWSNLGVLCYAADRFAEAIPCFSKAITLGDRDPMTFGLLGYCLERTGNVVAAEMAYMQAIAGDPTSANWMEGLLRIYVQGKQYARAESLVKNLIKEHPQEARNWLTYANILLADGRKLEAIAMLEASAATGVAGTDELILLADLYAEQRLYPEALAIYQKVLVPSPALGERKLLNLAQVLISGGRWQEAQAALDSLPKEITPEGQINCLQARSDLFAAQKKWPEAREQLQELLRLAPLNGKALLSLGFAYAAEDDVPHATFAFEAACQISESAYRASLELANIELKNRHYDKSVEYLEKALRIEKTPAIEDDLARVRTLASKNR
ncbi:MAG TPA: tetratricopeptide repeat protein [Opitutaceae bacterium]|nr:tetratricopeptide repeat protein [Opitutaceae bacterium]